MKLFTIFIGLLLFGCCGPRNIQHSEKTTQNDSIYIEVVKVDTLKIPQEITRVEYQPKIMHDTIIVQKNNRSKAILRVKDKKITCEAYCDSIYKTYLSSIKTTQNNRHTLSTTKIQKTAIKPKDNFWKGFLAGGISTAAFMLGYKLAKNKI